LRCPHPSFYAHGSAYQFPLWWGRLALKVAVSLPCALNPITKMIDMEQIEFKELKYGFKYGDATIKRHMSDEKKGWIILGLETSKRKLQIYVTKTGKVRIHDENGKKWLPSNNR
jgi:hypothetical protein